MTPERRPYAVVGALLAVPWGGLELRAALATPGAPGDAARERARLVAFVSLEACFVGGPLEPGESLIARVRAVDAARRLDPAVEGAAARGAWPSRCAPLARRLGEAMAGEGGNGYLASVAPQLAATLERGVPDELSVIPFDTLGTSFTEADRSLVPADVPRAPPPARPALPRFASHFPEAHVWSRGAERDGELRLSLAGLQLGCRLRTDRPEARCWPVPDGASRGRYAPLVASGPDAGPLLVGYGDSAGSALVDLDAGAVLAEVPGYLAGAGRAADGALAFWSSEADRMKLFVQRGGEPSRGAPEPDGAAPFGEVLLHADGARTVARALGPGGALGAAVTIPVAAEWQADDVQACHAGADLFAVARRRGEGAEGALVLVRRGEQWAHHAIGLRAPVLACDAGGASVAPGLVEGGASFARCSFEGCREEGLSPPPFFAGVRAGDLAPQQLVGAPCGDRVLVAARSKTAVEIALAAPGALATAPRRLLYQATLVHDVDLLAGAGGVLALIHGYEGRALARIACDGAVQPVVADLAARR